MKLNLTKKEVLITILCIFVLMMTLGAVGSRGRSHAKFIVCQSNLQKWGQIFQLFAQDNDDKLPPSIIADGSVTAQEAFWIGATLPYYDSEIIRFCPMAKPDMDIAPAFDAYGGTFENWGPFPESPNGSYWFDAFSSGSYGFNDWCACPPEGMDSYWGFPADQTWRYVTVEGAENIPLLMDSIFVDGFVLETNYPPVFEGDFDTWDYNAIKLFCIDRHDGGINIVFLDMSVRKIGLKELWTLKWHKDYDTAGPWTHEDAPWPTWMADF